MSTRLISFRELTCSLKGVRIRKIMSVKESRWYLFIFFIFHGGYCKGVIKGLYFKCWPRENLKKNATKSLWEWYRYIHMSKAQSKSRKEKQTIKAWGYHQENQKYVKSVCCFWKQFLSIEKKLAELHQHFVYDLEHKYPLWLYITKDDMRSNIQQSLTSNNMVY